MAKEKNYRRHGSRYRARRRAVDIIFEAETRDVDPVAIVEERRELSVDQESGVAPIADYTAELVQGTAERLDEVDDAIARYLSDEWELRRLPAVDRAVLRVAAWEIMYNPEVDAPISIADGVEIASQYSTDVAAPYINAVLDDIAQSLSQDNPMGVDVGTESSVEASVGDGGEETEAESVEEVAEESAEVPVEEPEAKSVEASEEVVADKPEEDSIQ